MKPILGNIWKWVTVCASLSSIIGLLIVFLSDGKAEPYISTRLDTPIKIMQYKVLLSYKPNGYKEKAIFERKQISSEVDSNWTYIDSVPFESDYKQYQYVIVDPEPGFIYRIRWTK